MDSAEKTVIGVDVGSGSVRAGIFNLNGTMLAHSTQKITTTHRSGSRVEQSSAEIWQAACRCIQEVLHLSNIPSQRVAGIGFDATCSLVVLGEHGTPLSVSPDGEDHNNIIVWMDHRATEQAERINATGHPVLDYVGGKISPEMETPKLLWLKEHHRATYDNAWQFMDLADFMTWRATSDLTRSACTVTCKWTWLAHENRWDEDYFHTIGLDDLADKGFQRIGQNIAWPGTPCDGGLSAQAAQETGLLPGTPVGVGIIDAHAGGIGTTGAQGDALSGLAWVFGTSSCTMTLTQEPAFVPGVWGPYYGAMVPGLWLCEGGQSAAGAAIDRLLASHPDSLTAKQEADCAGVSLPVYLANLILQKFPHPSDAIQLAAGLHVVPEFLGNRAPLADPHARAIIAGLGMEQDRDSLLSLYLAGLCGIGYGLRQIIDAQAKCGVISKTIIISGGAGQHPVVRQILADTCGLPVITTQSPEPVLLGAAILGAVAGKVSPSVNDAMAQFTHMDKCYNPNRTYQSVHQKRYQAYELLQQTAKKIRE